MGKPEVQGPKCPMHLPCLRAGVPRVDRRAQRPAHGAASKGASPWVGGCRPVGCVAGPTNEPER